MPVLSAKIQMVRMNGGNRQISRGQNELTTKLAGSWPKHFRNIGVQRRDRDKDIDCDRDKAFKFTASGRIFYGTGDILLKSRVH